MSDFWGSVATQSETALDNNFFEFIAYFGVYFKAGQGRRRWCVSAKMGNVFEVWTVWVLVLSFWMRIGVLHHEEATGCVGGGKIVRFCKNLLAMTCVVLIFMLFFFFFFFFYLFPVSSRHCDMAMQVGGLVSRS